MKTYVIHINFAYRTFIWNSEAKEKAHVHCVIIGFSKKSKKNKKIYGSGGYYEMAENISPYLTNSPNVFVTQKMSLYVKFQG